MSYVLLEKISYKEKELNDIAYWRDKELHTLRTSDLTGHGESQRKWVDSLRETEKYFFIYLKEIYKQLEFLGYCGLDKIHLANRTAEISLLISPFCRRKGYGRKAIDELLKFSFEVLNLNLIYGESYQTTDSIEFWYKVGFKKEGVLRMRKYWAGDYYDSIMFSMTREEWEKHV